MNTDDEKRFFYKIVRSNIGLILILMMICGCSGEIRKSDTVLIDGILFQKNEKEPFSGFVLGKERKGGRGKVFNFKKQYKNGILNGKTQYFYRNGKLESSIPYKKGKIHGMVATYYDNGQIKSRIHYVNGQRGGSKGEIFWDRDGKIRKG